MPEAGFQRLRREGGCKERYVTVAGLRRPRFASAVGALVCAWGKPPCQQLSRVSGGASIELFFEWSFVVNYARLSLFRQRSRCKRVTLFGLEAIRSLQGRNRKTRLGARARCAAVVQQGSFGGSAAG